MLDERGADNHKWIEDMLGLVALGGGSDTINPTYEPHLYLDFFYLALSLYMIWRSTYRNDVGKKKRILYGVMDWD